MAFIDSGVQANAFGGINPGAPTGSGIANASTAGTSGYPTQSGSNGLGSGVAQSTWTLVYLGLIAGILFCTGVIFNGKGRRSP